ncbi:cyanate lyase [Anoxybacillus tepidamans]|uniref:Cyanate hydratase n=1 Tax=Anoxybacteroides tepidamans TaxID=265948 RepID=A0A7W8ITF9_9BACL|nr:cyanase [Anoxybacillus tepidamans]MBB5326373.1 cyanate lyase [Anoxybacillus tepidamans]
MKTNQMIEMILEAKKKKGLTFSQIAETIGRSEVWTAAALLGQHTMDEKEAEKVVNLLELPAEVSKFLQTIPYRGTSFSMPPTDPTIYRFYEIILVYGEALKALIHEKFGDGIMSAIDFSMDLEKEEDPKGDRVVIKLNGKYLPYKKF